MATSTAVLAHYITKIKVHSSQLVLVLTNQ